jgi:hypothetical protein
LMRGSDASVTANGPLMAHGSELCVAARGTNGSDLAID